MNDLVLNLLPFDGNRCLGTISSAMNRATFNAADFCSGRQLSIPCVPKFFGMPVNGGGGWSGGGIAGTYYSNNNYTGASFVRADVRIDMPPTTVLPGGSLATDPVYGSVIGATNFSVKWVGTLIPKYTTTYTFKVKTGGTLTLKIGGVTVATATAASGWVSVGYAFTAGQSVAVEVDMVQGTGPWSAQVHWLGAGTILFPEEAIGPATPIGTNNAPERVCAANGAIDAQYFNAINGTAGPALDGNGWPTGDFAFQQMSDSNFGNGPYSFPNVGFAADTSTGIWTIQFTGCAGLVSNDPSGNAYFLIGHNDGSHSAVSLNGLTYYKYAPYYGQTSTIPVSAMVWDPTTGTGYNSSNNTTTVLFHGGWSNIGFLGTDRSGTGAPGGPSGTPASNGLTNIFCMKPSSVGSTTSYKVGTAMNDPYLASMSHYTCARDNLRSYDIDLVASVSNPYTDWGKRSTPAFCAGASDTNQNPSYSTPYEYLIMAANQSGKDLYVCFPQSASGNASDSDYQSSYLYNLALLIKNGSTFNGVSYPGLLPHLNVYLECGNENWNYSSYSLPLGWTWTQSMIHAANANRVANTKDWQQYVGMDGYTQTDSSGNLTYIHNSAWTAIKLKDASDLFRIVFGDSTMPGGPNGLNPDPRIRPIYELQQGAQYGNYGYPDQTLASFASYFGITVNHVFWGGGGACYATFAPAGSNADGVFSNMSLAANKLDTSFVQADVDLLARYGLHHLSYEGGFSFYTGDGQPINNALQQASNDSRVIPYVAQVVNQYFQAGGNIPVISTANGGPYGFSLGICNIDGVWDEPPYATAPPKLQAYLNAEAALPATIVAPSAWYVIPFTVQSPYAEVNGQSFILTFVIPASGYYTVKITTVPQYTNAIGTMTITIDGALLARCVTTDHTIAQSYPTLAYLAQGVHGLVVLFTGLTPSSNGITITCNIQ